MFKFLFGKKEKKDMNESHAAVSPEKSGGAVQPKQLSEKKLVAIATAAIAASRGCGDCAIDVISIQKIS